ncbi:peptidase S53, partial [Mycobacterium sp. ITM-2017-0098]
GLSVSEHRPDDKLIEGPYASLLDASTDLGPAREQSIEFTASLPDRSRPAALIDWARNQSLSVRWRPGDDWVVVEGSPDAVGQAF